MECQGCSSSINNNDRYLNLSQNLACQIEIGKVVERIFLQNKHACHFCLYIYLAVG